MSEPFTLTAGKVAGHAAISPCKRYRYDLLRTWAPYPSEFRRVAFLMLNPSVADASVPDNTMTRCVDYAKQWGFGGLVLVNLFAYRSTDPDELKNADDPIGPENDRFIARWAKSADLLVCGWGAHPFARERAKVVLRAIREAGAVPHYLKLTKDGDPGHPLFLRKDLVPMPMEDRS